MWKIVASCYFVAFLPSILLGQQLHFEAAFKNREIPQIPIALLQDSQGFLWIGTTDGVYRYDGHEVREFRHNPRDAASISNNFVSELYEDRQGNIWMGTRNGLNCYHSDTEKISRHLAKAEDGLYILSVMEDHNGMIWYGSYEGLWRLDPKTKETIQYLPDIEREQTLSNKLVWSVFEDNQQRIWLGTKGGFTVFKNDDSFQFQAYFGDYEQINGLATDNVFDIIQQADSTIWLSSYDGIFKVKEENNSFQFQQLNHQKNNKNSLSDNRVYDFKSGGTHKIWAGTWAGGLNEIILPKNDQDSIRFVHHRHDPKDDSSISLDRIESFLVDQSGLIWVGTGTRLDKASQNTHKFHQLKSSSNDPNSLSNDIIKSIYKDSYGNLWVGTFSGLNFLSADKLKNKDFSFERFKHNPNDAHSISHNNIFGINEDSRGYLWISSFSGLNYIHIPSFMKDRKFYHFDERHGIPHTFNSNVLEIEEGTYWLACYNALAKMSFDPEEPEQVTFERFEMDEDDVNAIVNSTTDDIIQDKFGDYWIGTFDGISKYIVRNGQELFENYKHEAGNAQSLSNNSFRCFFKDDQSRIWIGTRSGLNLMQQKTRYEPVSFKVFGIADGLPNDVIHSIEQDEEGMLWIATNKGLVVFNPDYEASGEKPVVKVYDGEDGLTNSSFVFRASYKDEEGNLYFGTGSGLNYFHPKHIPTNSYIPPVRFTKLKILNETVTPQDSPNAVLQKSISLSEKISLKHWQNIISLDFAAMDFNKPEKNQYKYKLSSLNDDWVGIGTENSVSFTNLSSGTHVLQVKGSNNDGIWNDTPTQLIIEVLPPFWKTWWAFVLYFLAFVGIVYAFIQFRIQKNLDRLKAEAKLEKAREEERELLRKNNAADFHDELGHRFTKISLFLELAERQSEANSSIKEYLSKIKTNAMGLSEAVRDLIWSLDPKKDSVYQTLLRLQEFGDNLFEFSSIHFKTMGFEASMDAIELAPDLRKNVLMIFKEAMNNALKYSEAKNVFLSAMIVDDEIKISLRDDGKGFDAYQIKTSYGLKNMKSRAEKFEAKIDINSTVGEGTEIVLQLKHSNIQTKS